MTNRDLGDFGESLAEQMLIAKGYRILERNWRVREGEVDVIALGDQIVVFAEVKTRISETHGSPEEAVNEAKQSQLLMLGQIFMGQVSDDLRDYAWRIDVIAIVLTPDHQVRRIRHYTDAVRFE